MTLKKIDKESADRLCCLVIGKPGIGKTSLIRTIRDEKALVLSAESGLLAVRDLVVVGRVEGFEISSLEDFRESLQLVQTNKEFRKRYSWIFIDSLTEIAARCEAAMDDRYPDPKDSFKKWGEYSKAMTSLIKSFRDLSDYNVVFTCLETVDKDENNRRWIAPAMSGKTLKEKIPAYFDLVLYYNTFINDKGIHVRVLFTQPYNEYPAKDRSGKLDDMEVPDLTAIKTKILKGV